MVLSARTRAWTALGVPPLAWFAFQQGLAQVVRLRCAAAGIAGPIGGVAALAACAGAAALAWRLSRRESDNAFPWLCRVALLGAGVFALAVAFQTLATLMVPSCGQ